jgi:hypothetical protein
MAVQGYHQVKLIDHSAHGNGVMPAESSNISRFLNNELVTTISSAFITVISIIAVKKLRNIMVDEWTSSLGFFQRAGIEFISSMSIPVSFKIFDKTFSKLPILPRIVSGFINSTTLMIPQIALATIGSTSGYLGIALGSTASIVALFEELWGCHNFRNNDRNFLILWSGNFAALSVIYGGLVFPSWQRLATSCISLIGFTQSSKYLQ